MAELRYHMITRDWVIMATERAKRPMDFVRPRKTSEAVAAHKDDCPFCPGHEGDRSDETFCLGDKANWKVRSNIINSPRSPRKRSSKG